MGIRDFFGGGDSDIKKSLGSGEAMSEVGTTGLDTRSGFIIEEFLPALQGNRAAKVFREMGDNDPVVGAIMFLVDMLVRSVKWSAVPASDDQRDIDAAEFLEQNMHDMSHTWEAFISEAMTMIQFGWSFAEQVYKVRGGESDDSSRRSKFNDGRIGWRKLAPRAQDTLFKWEFDEDGGVTAMIQQAPPDFTPRRIPIEKGLLFRTTIRKNNPEGKSLLRNAYRPWFFKKRIEEIEAIGIERDLAGYPSIGVPRKYLTRDASPAEKETVRVLKRIVTNIRRDSLEGLVRPIEYDDNGNEMFPFELASTNSRRQFDTSAIITRYDQRIAMTILADFILLGHDKVGSFALSNDKTNIFTTALVAILDEIKSVVNNFAVRQLFDLNAFNIEELPQIEYTDPENVDVSLVAEVLSKISMAGADVFPDDEVTNAILRTLGLPERTPNESDI